MNPRIVIAFLAGIVVAGGVAYLAVNSREQTPAPVAETLRVDPVQTTSTIPPGQQPQEMAAPGPKATSSPAAPVRKSPGREAASSSGRLSSPAPAPAKTIPVETAQTAPPPASSTVEPPAPEREAAVPPRARAVNEPSSEKPPPPAARAPRAVTIPAGTLIPVRLVEKVSTETHSSGDTFSATLDQPLIVEGLVIAERSARAEGRVVESTPSGRVKGLASLVVQLTRLQTADGQRVDIQTETFTRQAEKSTTSDAAKVGVGAAIGAAIGAIAGGGRGAAIGAGAGGAAGAGTVLATRGKAAELPAETRLSFKLSEAVSVTERLER